MTLADDEPVTLAEACRLVYLALVECSLPSAWSPLA